MKFYDRKTEMAVLKRNRELSKNSGIFTVITGRRRIGKTALVHESEKRGKFLYLFVSRGSESLLCEQLTGNAETDLGIKLFNTNRFHDLFEQLMTYGEKNSFTFAIDEFQDLERINHSVMSSIQELWDKYKSTTKVNLIVCGSLYSMMIKIFEREKEPLFGRAVSKLSIGPFGPSVLKNILADYNPDYGPDDLLFLYMVSGGVPKYIEILMDRNAVRFDDMLDAVCSPDSQFLTDGKDLLISEFGKDYGTYFSILQLIAKGKNTMREMSEAIGKESGSYLDNLEKEYGLVRKNRPLFSKENSRDVRWHVSDNYLNFYFRFISGNISLTELKKYDLLKEKIRSEYTQYSGIILENYFKEKIAEEQKVTEVGSYWDRRGQNEIDIIALNDIDMTASIFEVKRNPGKADIGELKKKTASVTGLKDFEFKFGILSLNDL
ncbi:MAG: ATP-binding protein [Candidatus Methanoplasma sp.]|jgi:AAA+ ATPase superfamily predicted ATPase|nr:ATP-binding protein [Candidatus Methanoplasma sp.]